MIRYVIDTFTVFQEQYRVMRGAMLTLRLTKWELLGLSLRKAFHDTWIFVSEPMQSWQGLSSATQIAIVVFSAFLAVWSLDRGVGRRRSLKGLGLPVLKISNGTHPWDYKTMLDQGARCYPDQPYIISYAGYEYVVYPSSLFDEVKRLTASKASAIDWFTEVLFQGWRVLGADSSALHKAIAVDLARAVPCRVSQSQSEAEQACDAILSPGLEWQSFPLFSTMQQIVVTTNSTGLVGRRLGSDKRWLNAVQRFPIALMVAIYISHAAPRLLRPLISMIVYLPAKGLFWYMKALAHYDASKDFKEYQETSNNEKQRNLLLKKCGEKFPMAAWLMRRYQPHERNVGQIKHDFVLGSFHATPSIAATLYCIMSELVVRPDIMQELRNELLQVVVVRTPPTAFMSFKM